MSRYLVVAHQTATSPELTQRVRDLAADDPQSEFVLIVPATPIEHMLTWSEGEAKANARRTADEAKSRLEAMGARIVRAQEGDPSPLAAIADELQEHAGEYDAIVISTLPPGISRWLKLDIPHQAKRRFGLPIIHVAATRQPAPAQG